MGIHRKSMKEWLAFFRQVDIPVLKQTADELKRLRDQEPSLDQHCTVDPRCISNPRCIAKVVERDPLMTVKLIRFLQMHKHEYQSYELIDVKQILLMIGLDVFFREVPAEPIVEDILQDNPVALSRLLKVVSRAQRAAYYAHDWTRWLHQTHFEEAQITALLTHVAEMLMLCFNPGPMLEIRNIMNADKNLRSDRVQTLVLGFSGKDLQRRLAIEWGLPRLLIDLLDPKKAKADRVRHVMLAVNLARHLESGWDNAALPDDYQEIAALLHVGLDEVMEIVRSGPNLDK